MMLANAEVKKCIQLSMGMWYYRGKFITRVPNKDNKLSWMVYNKFQNKKCVDFIFEAPTLRELTLAFDIFSEDIPAIIVEEMAVDGVEDVNVSE